MLMYTYQVEHSGITKVLRITVSNYQRADEPRLAVGVGSIRWVCGLFV